ncbi:hypothetical protein [Aquibacillus kalidii]|uniref:hypothetical protein n=1 Tax=Aquibacillus kalidii TaxID=2762597 RepID=UPI0016483AF7|nr:hypothetical protein [Aquibacillus kalidii]
MTKEESILSHLMVDGFHAWGGFYKTLINCIKIDIPINEHQKKHSVAQAINLRSHVNEGVRRESHQALEAKWQEREELFAKILNHITGFRLQVYKRKQRKTVLGEYLKKILNFSTSVREETNCN